MTKENIPCYEPLSEPIPITEQVWPDKTLPFVHTRTMTYMHEKYIKDCIEGILMQRTTFPVQVLIHDDASTDKTVEIVKYYENKYPKLIKAYYQTENSYSKPDKEERRMEFVKWRIGKYEATCEGDDYWTDPLKLQKQVELMLKNPECSMCVAQTEWVKNDEVINVSGNGDKLKYNFNDMISGIYFHTSTYLVEKKCLDLYINTNNKLKLGDTSLRYFMSDLGPLILLNEKVSVYRITGEGVWTGLDNKRRMLWHIKVFKTFYYDFKPIYRSIFNKKLIDNYLSLLIFDIKNLNAKDSLINLGQLLFWSLNSPIYFAKSIFKYFNLFINKVQNNIGEVESKAKG